MKRRSYHQYCAAARALDVVGERWTLLIVRNLLLGPRRYSDLLEELPGITTNLLAKRLREMAESGLIRRESLGAPSRAEVYRLTERGQELEPVLMALGRWGGSLMAAPHKNDVLDPGWALLSFKNRYRGGLELELELRVEGKAFELLFEGDTLRVQQRSATRPAAIVSTSHATLARLLFAREPLAPLVRLGHVTIEGDPRAFRAMLDATTV